MDVRRNRQAGMSLNRLQGSQSLLQTWPAERFSGGSVGLVERGFEDQRDGELVGDLAQGLGNPQGQVMGLDDAGPSNPNERPAGAAHHIPDNGHGLYCGHGLSSMKPE
jgi:hypothetical protein